MIRFFGMGLVLALLAGSLAAAEGEKHPARPPLMVGDPAPPFKVGKWVQGDPVTSFEKGKVYMIEFWASWCGPCKISTPHINGLHLKFKDRGFNIIGVAIREDDPKDTTKFVREMSTNMTYRVALDDTSEGEPGKMDKLWMQAADYDGIPHAFIVNQKGIVAWIGSPFDLKDDLIEEFLGGKYDVAKAAEKYARIRKNTEEVQKLELAFEQAAEKKDWDKAEELLAQRQKLAEEEDLPSLGLTRLDLKLQKEDIAAAEKIARELQPQNPDQILFQDGLAWTILTAKKQSPELLNVAEKSANRANEIGHGQDPAVLETIGRLQFIKGEKAAAIATMEKAIAMVDPQSRTKVRLERQRESYLAGELPKEE